MRGGAGRGYTSKEVREKQGITQEELSNKSGVSRAIIASLENDDNASTTTKTLSKIAQALGVPVSQIFFG